MTRRESPPQNHPKPPQNEARKGLWLAGVHAVSAALENPNRNFFRLLATAESARTHDRMLKARSPVGVEIVSKNDIDRHLPAGTVHQGLAAQVDPLPAVHIEDLVALADGKEEALIIILDQVTDPHNVGAILRSAAAFGALGVVVPDRHAPEETTALAKSASGALERMPLVRVTNLARALDELKKGGFWVCGLDAAGPITLSQAKLTGKIVLALGAEGDGLRRLTRETCDYLVRLPMTGTMESLNVSNAAAVALYEFVRERI
jgi:23S rRNA (guanosine2251-2'-O)-methyltransferase